jgi:hypothetical protein
MADSQINEVGATLVLLNKGSINDIKKWIFEKCADFSRYNVNQHGGREKLGPLGLMLKACREHRDSSSNPSY